jgi:hypothetical protein
MSLKHGTNRYFPVVQTVPASGVLTGTIYSVTLPGAESGQEIIDGVAATPGWEVIDAFRYVSTEPTVPAPGTVARLFSAVVIASTAALQVRLKLVRADTLADVAGSTLTFAPPVNATEQYAETADLTAVLVNGVIYQIVAECTGGALPTDFASIRSSNVRAVITY